MIHPDQKRMSRLFLICPLLLLLTVMCDRADADRSDRSGSVIVVYDSEACECVRKQGETILHQIDSLRTAHASLDRYFAFRQIDWDKEREAANAVLDRCSDPLIPVVLIEDPQEQTVFNFSFEFDPRLFHQITRDLIEMKTGN